MIRVEIETNELAALFNKPHRDITKAVKKLVESCDIAALYFSASTYKTERGRVYDSHTMDINGFCLLTDTWGFSRGESAIVKAKILNEFGETFSVVGSSRSRFECDFYQTLVRFLNKDKVIRQYPIGKFKVDFYIPSSYLIIEYDEEQHFSKKSLNSDEQRMSSIKEFYFNEFDCEPAIVRVKKGMEIEGLSEIMGAITLNSMNGVDCTKYSEEAAKEIGDSKNQLGFEG